jgi:mannose-6-phosphate isomerase-like protein (cupin superfamily)
VIRVNINESEPFTTKDGATIRSILDRSNAPVKNQSLAEATVPPGRTTTGHRHPESEEIYFIVSGSGVLTVGDEASRVKPGDAVLIPPGTHHAAANDGAGPLVLLCCCAPPYSHDDTILAGEEDEPGSCP